jgi:hypothetical protein
VNAVGDHTLLLGEEGERLRWFLLPSEVAGILTRKTPSYLPKTPPFTPPIWDTPNGTPVRRKFQRKDIENEDITEVSETLPDKTQSYWEKPTRNGNKMESNECELQTNHIELENKSSEKIANNSELKKFYGESAPSVEDKDALCDGELDKNVTFPSKDSEQVPDDSKENLGPGHTLCESNADRYQISEGLSTNVQGSNEKISTAGSTRMDCRTLDEACSLKKQGMKNASNKIKNTTSDSDTEAKNIEKTDKDVVTKPKFFHPPKSIFKPTIEVSVILFGVVLVFLSVSLW